MKTFSNRSGDLEGSLAERQRGERHSSGGNKSYCLLGPKLAPPYYEFERQLLALNGAKIRGDVCSWCELPFASFRRLTRTPSTVRFVEPRDMLRRFQRQLIITLDSSSKRRSDTFDQRIVHFNVLKFGRELLSRGSWTRLSNLDPCTDHRARAKVMTLGTASQVLPYFAA